MTRRRLAILGAFAAVGVLVIVASVGHLVIRATNRTNQNTAILTAIQHERVRNTLRACNDQNDRHDALKKYIDALVAHPQPGRPRLPKKQRDRQAAGFVNAIAPHRDCARVVAQSIK
jgi:hypothetical protein